jgi:hypothetical protein
MGKNIKISRKSNYATLKIWMGDQKKKTMGWQRAIICCSTAATSSPVA